MLKPDPEFEICLATDEADILAGQRLRYDVFIDELGGDGPLVDHAARLERDEFDPYFDHLLLRDKARPGAPAVGVYRLMRDDQMPAAGRYYSEAEYDLTALKSSGRKLMELGRSCVHPDYRGGEALKRLWQGLLDYTLTHGIEVMFGVASFHGTNIDALKLPLSYLHHEHLAPPELRTRALAPHYHRMDLMPRDAIDQKAAMRQMPALIKAYLRLGGTVGEGAFVDRPFNTTDVCIIVDLDQVPARTREMFGRGLRG
ncbi:GNAT family N-acetyltransferase [Maritimibacter fusiformis]|uniref:L-ornithine N(alpha)-acyltransferase n=1 Tax=Maritimibacter fusiformis TaxID=2603819 RepID=A0A5D0RQA6_9RHOB|nr:GNAT family N-acyltransferase [Maritimibacter fusiformis]TYB82848.1 GNAT family N-acetyltransferase [Maritimibacter fusiformis]